MYDKTPFIPVGPESACSAGWEAITRTLSEQKEGTSCGECYPGVFTREIVEAILHHMQSWKVILAEKALLPEAAIEDRFAQQLTDDPVFGRMSETTLADFFDAGVLATLTREASATSKVLVVGTG